MNFIVLERSKNSLERFNNKNVSLYGHHCILPSHRPAVCVSTKRRYLKSRQLTQPDD